MSADNVVGIGKFPSKNGSFEYRVGHFQNMENHDSNSSLPKDLRDLIIFQDYCDSKIYNNLLEATDAAIELHDSLDICEYGICHFEYVSFLDISKDEAQKRLNEYWDNLSKF